MSKAEVPHHMIGTEDSHCSRVTPFAGLPGPASETQPFPPVSVHASIATHVNSLTNLQHLVRAALICQAYA